MDEITPKPGLPREVPNESIKTDGKGEDPRDAYGFQVDDLKDPHVMHLQIPMAAIAAATDANAIIFMLGFFEHAKNEAIALIKRKRQANMNAASSRGIITTGRVPLKIQ